MVPFSFCGDHTWNFGPPALPPCSRGDGSAYKPTKGFLNKLGAFSVRKRAAGSDDGFAESPRGGTGLGGGVVLASTFGC